MTDAVEPGEITQLLHAHEAGSQEAFDSLVDIAYQQLKRLARQQLRRARPSATLDTVALVHEAYLKLFSESGVEWENRSHFYAVMARAMRFVVVDNARRNSAQKRGDGHRPATLDPERLGVDRDDDLTLAVDDAIRQLETFDGRLAYVVECRFFAGMTETEIAESLGVTTRTVQREWRRARAWLHRILAVATPVDT
ncbi:MAG: sigma-70 family RNA polymerase sigma factor [Thermoanaerobaculia bacterium]|nr:sigma-70 family RNA polymerase sigma factor [Thermoanaerobaculia bacterium]